MTTSRQARKHGVRLSRRRFWKKNAAFSLPLRRWIACLKIIFYSLVQFEFLLVSVEHVLLSQYWIFCHSFEIAPGIVWFVSRQTTTCCETSQSVPERSDNFAWGAKVFAGSRRLVCRSLTEALDTTHVSEWGRSKTKAVTESNEVSLAEKLALLASTTTECTDNPRQFRLVSDGVIGSHGHKGSLQRKETWRGLNQQPATLAWLIHSHITSNATSQDTIQHLLGTLVVGEEREPRWIKSHWYAGIMVHTSLYLQGERLMKQHLESTWGQHDVTRQVLCKTKQNKNTIRSVTGSNFRKFPCLTSYPLQIVDKIHKLLVRIEDFSKSQPIYK